MERIKEYLNLIIEIVQINSKKFTKGRVNCEALVMMI